MQISQQLFDLILTEMNIPGCLRDISQFWGFRSTVPGPGLRKAAEFLVRRHQENGMDACLRAYPADDLTPSIDGRKNPLAWTPRYASLELVEPAAEAGLICTYTREPLCLLSNSTSTPADGLTAEVVVLHSGTQPEDYAGLDVKGKIVFTDVWPLLADTQARLHGAAGLITDSVTPPWLYRFPPVRRAADVPDLTMWGTLDGKQNERPLWGFSLTPRQGERLRRIIRESHEPVRLRAHVDASLEPGLSELVDALLHGDGSSSQEIWVLSHCSEPGALDDASACCLTLEIARVLKTLVDSGRLPKPRRSIRFLNAAEVEGYLPYLHAMQQNGGLDHVAASLALDAVGSDFRQSGATQRLFRNPDTNPSYTDALAEELLRRVAALPNERFTADTYDLFPWQIDPNFPGNDNFLADGFFDIPTPMLCCWPDRFYHSNLDTVDKLSPNSLGRAGLIAASYLYFLASAGEDEVKWLAGLTIKNYKQRIIQDPLPRLAWEGCEALAGLQRLESGAGAIVQAGRAELEDFARRELPASHPPSPAWEGADFTPRPKRWQPDWPLLTPYDEKVLKSLRDEHPDIDQAWGMINGRRKASQIALGLQLPEKILLSYFSLLHRHGWIERDDIQIEIRASTELRPEERDEKDRLMRTVFGEFLDEMAWSEDNWHVLVRVGGDLATHVGIVDRTVLAGSESIRIGGVGGVATLPAYRGQGLASLAMQRAARFMRGAYNAEAGLLICDSRLGPFYQGLGWMPISDPVIFDQPGQKIANHGEAYYLPCSRPEWPSGQVDLCGYPW